MIGIGVSPMLGGRITLSPASIPGLALWLDASRLSLADLDPVPTWTDQSGNGRHATQATTSKQPVKVTVSGRQYVRFDGVDDLLTMSAAFDSSTEGLVFAVLIPRASLASKTLFASSDEATNTSQIQLISFHTGNETRIVQQNAGDVADNVRGGTALVTGTPCCVMASSSGTAYRIVVNGTAETITVTGGANTGDWLGDTTGRDNASIGALKRLTEAGWTQLDLAELCYFAGTGAAAYEARLTSYARSKWGTP